MNYIKLIFSTLLFFAFTGTEMYAQEAIVTTGGEASDSEGAVSYSVGQIAYITKAGTSGFITDGVQQPYEISLITSLETTAGINLIGSVYPNPTSNLFFLKIENYTNERLSYHLFDVNGRLLEEKNLTGEVTTISMANWTPATYFLKVIEEQRELKTFKIIKH